MGSFFARDKLDDYRISLLDDEITNMDDTIVKLTLNMGILQSDPGYTRFKEKTKRQRILRGGPHMHKICYNICDIIEPDPSDKDDMMIMSEMCKYRVKVTCNNLAGDDWLTLWDETVALLEKIERNVENWEHMHYYCTMCNVLKVIKLIYKRRDEY